MKFTRYLLLIFFFGLFGSAYAAECNGDSVFNVHLILANNALPGNYFIAEYSGHRGPFSTLPVTTVDSPGLAPVDTSYCKVRPNEGDIITFAVKNSAGEPLWFDDKTCKNTIKNDTIPGFDFPDGNKYGQYDIKLAINTGTYGDRNGAITGDIYFTADPDTYMVTCDFKYVQYPDEGVSTPG